MKGEPCELYDRECIECGECDICDLDPNKTCDSCGKCLHLEEYSKILIDGIFESEEAWEEFLASKANEKNQK